MKIYKRTLLLIGIYYALLFLGSLIFYVVNPFENECIKGSCVNAYGIYIYNSGLQYEGEWKNGRRHGKGTLTYPDRYKYVGEWKNNKREGHGKLVYTYSKIPFYYVGEWKDGKRDGKGIFYYYGKKYEGHWNNDLMHGRGTVIYPGGYKWTGEWKNDMADSGQGTFLDNNGKRFEGQAKNGKMYGKIIITYSDGSKFIGEVISGGKHIQGTIVYPDGRELSKTLKNNLL